MAGVSIRWPDPSSYRYARRRIAGDQLVTALRQYVRVDEVPLDQPYNGAVLFEFVRPPRRHRVVVETSDYAELNEDRVHGGRSTTHQ